jgi:hypothetical protein
MNCVDVTLQASPHPGTPGSTVGAPPTSYPGLAPTPDTDGPIKIERLSGTTASKFESETCSKLEYLLFGTHFEGSNMDTLIVCIVWTVVFVILSVSS